MMCSKCGSRQMVDDSYGDIKVHKCWVCGNRFYVDYPKRLGSCVCYLCGDAVDAQNELGYCTGSVKLLDIPGGRMKVRRKSAQHLFHSQDCMKRLARWRWHGTRV